MPNLVAVDVSVTDSRIRLAFSDRAVAAAYAAYLRAQDMRQHQAIPGYRRAPHFHTAAKAVTLSLPDFITWFITCRLPDDEDAVTFTCMDEHADHATRWADAMLLFEPVPGSSSTGHHSHSHSHHHSHHHHHHHHANDLGFSPGESSGSDSSSGGAAKQLHVRRLWNRAHLLRRLEELRRLASAPTTTGSTPTKNRSRVGSPVWGNGVNGAGRMPVALGGTGGPGGMQRADIWW